MPDPGQSFKLFTPSLRNYFFWHYHSEHELFYVEAVTGIQHVGQHISSYNGSDLVLISPNIPHFNFDHGVQTEYWEVVVQLKQAFLGDAFVETPEFSLIRKLFERAAFGLSFGDKTKEVIVVRLLNMQGLTTFEQLLHLFQVFQILATATDVIQLNTKDTSIKAFLDDKI